LEQIYARRNALRAQMGEKRGLLSEEQVKESSWQISRRLKQLPVIQRAQTVMGYYRIGNEVDIVSFLKELHGEKTVFLPRTTINGDIEPVKFENEDFTRKGRLGIIEPIGEPCDPGDLDVILVPGLVFDYKGYRLGYGKGFYDRFLGRIRKDAYICGIAYDFQIVETVLPLPSDIPVHWIVTEKSEVAVDWKYF